MSVTTFTSDNSYQSYQEQNPIKERKGKFKKVDDTNAVYKKIVQFKKKNKIGESQWVSEYDVYKTTNNKKRLVRQKKTVRTVGYDYKNYVNSDMTIEDEENMHKHYINPNNHPEDDQFFWYHHRRSWDPDYEYQDYDDRDCYWEEERRARNYDKRFDGIETRERRWTRREKRESREKSNSNYMW